MNTIRTKKGFSLLLAVLVGSLLISVGLGIFNLTYKESIISSSGRESEFALYSADSGIECVLYFDVEDVDTQGYFSTSTTQDDYADNGYLDNLKCNGQTPKLLTDTMSDYYRSGTDASTTLEYGTDDGDSLCVDVTVGKHLLPDSSLKTIIQARGYNTCDDSNPRRVERGLYIKY